MYFSFRLYIYIYSILQFWKLHMYYFLENTFLQGINIQLLSIYCEVYEKNIIHIRMLYLFTIFTLCQERYASKFKIMTRLWYLYFRNSNVNDVKSHQYTRMETNYVMEFPLCCCDIVCTSTMKETSIQYIIEFWW